jgi:hypothetical protein
MDIQALWTALIGGVVTLTTLFGWSHTKIKADLERLENEMRNKPTYADLRAILEDKLAIKEVEYKSLTLQINELKLANKELSQKIEKLLDLAMKGFN